MPTLHERIEANYADAYKQSLKHGQRQREAGILRMVKAELQKVAIDKRTEKLADADVLPVLSKQAKQLQEALDAATKANRPELVAQAMEELDIVKTYLPQALSADAVKALIEDAIKTVGTNQGQIMKAVMAKAAGAADGKMVSQLVAERLKQPAKT